jgi:hypothetical protein
MSKEHKHNQHMWIHKLEHQLKYFQFYNLIYVFSNYNAQIFYG